MTSSFQLVHEVPVRLRDGVVHLVVAAAEVLVLPAEFQVPLGFTLALSSFLQNRVVY